MSGLSEKILETAATLPEGSIITSKELRSLTPQRRGINKALSRLERQGQLQRIQRGQYVSPIQSRFGRRPPSTASILQSISQQTGQIIVSHGATAANLLGLSTQVPIREIFITSSGKRQIIRLGRRTIELVPGPRWQWILGETRPGLAVRALAWLGPEEAPLAMPKLRQLLTSAEWEKIRSLKNLPSWLKNMIPGPGNE